LIVPVIGKSEGCFSENPFFAVFMPSFISSIRTNFNSRIIVDYTIFLGADSGDPIFDNIGLRSSVSCYLNNITSGYPVRWKVIQGFISRVIDY
jgi:hypothetical protein